MSTVVDKTIDALPPDQKAQVDLIILKSSTGKQAQIPRWLITKYPVLLAPRSDIVKLVLPWTSMPRIWDEGLPLDRLELKDVVQIEFANYRQMYGSLYLKRRTDPVALRGEKLFVQNCTSCHSMGIEKSARRLASVGHPPMKDAPKLKKRDLHALVSYLNEFKAENGATAAPTALHAEEVSPKTSSTN